MASKHSERVTRVESLLSSLSDREREVFRLIGDGLSRQQVAKRLFLSVKTIETYCTHMMKKLELADALELNQTAAIHEFVTGGVE